MTPDADAAHIRDRLRQRRAAAEKRVERVARAADAIRRNARRRRAEGAS